MRQTPSQQFAVLTGNLGTPVPLGPSRKTSGLDPDDPSHMLRLIGTPLSNPQEHLAFGATPSSRTRSQGR